MIWVIGGLLVVLVGVLGTGLVLMIKGGEANKKYGNNLMMARVMVQAVIILLLAMLFMASDKG